MDDIKRKILLEILNERLYKNNIIDEKTKNKILSIIWK